MKMEAVGRRWSAVPNELVRLFGEQLRVRALNPRDGAVWMLVISWLDPLTGSTDITAQEIADRLGMQRPHVVSSLQRLIRAGCLEKAYEGKTGTRLLSVPGCEVGLD